MINVQDIRQKFPSPKSAKRLVFKSDYSILGALYSSVLDLPFNCLDTTFRFPTITIASIMLMTANSSLKEAQARRFASEISVLNDKENFEAAWELLDKALSYNSGEKL